MRLPIAFSLVCLTGFCLAQAPQRLGSEIGYGIFQQQCMNCHGKASVAEAPAPAALREFSPEKLYEIIGTAATKPHQGLTLSDEQKRRIAEAVSGRLLGTAESGDAKLMPNRCPGNPRVADATAGSAWNGWGSDVANTRFQPAKAAGLAADQVPRLKLKWAFGFPGGTSAWGQPTVVSGRVFVGSDAGYVYSLDASTGCVYWSFHAKAAMRNAISFGPVKGHGSSRYAVYFGDLKANAYAVDAQNGELMWATHVDDHFTSRLTAAPALYDGRLYIPVSSWEGFNAKTPDYPCCTSRGSVLALDANTGRQIWKHYTIPDEPKPTKKNSAGTQIYGPSGGSVWDTPTVDVKRHAIYYGTGEAATGPASNATDAVVALDMNTGKLLWVYQTQQDDVYLVGCNQPNKPENCPDPGGPDYDIGNPPILKTLENGKSVVLAGMKNGIVFALDPDRKGALVWKTNVSPDPKSGILWGGAADEKAAYYGLTGGGVAGIQLATGERMWFNPLTPPPGRGRAANTAAITAIPGVAFSGARTGILYALSAADGHTLWEFDTAREFTTVNQVAANGGSIASAGATVAGGMLFVGSGYNFAGNDRIGNLLLAFSPE